MTDDYILPMSIPGATALPGIEAPRRGELYGDRYAIATEQPLASIAAMTTLQRGGNAIDAVIAASAVNAVTKPYQTQLGGDAFSLVWRRALNVVDCLNAGGRAPNAATLDLFAGHIDETGARASTVPGLVDAWVEMSTTYGTLSLEKCLEPAIRLARDGFPVSLRLSMAMTMLPNDPDYPTELRRLFLVDGKRPYAPGDTLRQPELADTLARIADEGREGFYAGEVATKIESAMRASGGIIDKADLAKSTAHWHDPLKTTYAGCEIYEQQLPTQGIIVLEALNIVEQFPLESWGFGSSDAVHVMVEALKLAFADSRRYSADPEVTGVPAEQLVSKEHARLHAAEIDLKRAGAPVAAHIQSDTTSFVVADEDMAVAFIQSVFAVWGSRFVVPGTGILMNNRLRAFSTDPAHPNALAPGKRAVHTLNTFLALRDGELVVGGGTPGADFQVQVNLQTLVNRLTWGMDLQSAIDAPRFAIVPDGLAIERRFPASLMDDLTSRGHKVLPVNAWDSNLARSQVLASRKEGGWAVASDLRGEGLALAW